MPGATPQLKGVCGEKPEREIKEQRSLIEVWKNKQDFTGLTGESYSGQKKWHEESQEQYKDPEVWGTVSMKGGMAENGINKINWGHFLKSLSTFTLST